MLPIANGINLLQIIIDRLIQLELPIVIATTDQPIDDKLIEYLSSRGISFFRGPESHVLSRFIGAAETFGFDGVVRVCADNPFIDIRYLQNLISLWSDKIDYLSHSYKNVPTVLSHFGVFAELVSLKALKKVLLLGESNQKYFEHVTFGIYSNPGLFDIKLVDITEDLRSYDGIRLTIDTKEDYLNLLKIYKQFVNDYVNLDFRTVGKWILTQPNLLRSMKSNITNNTK